VLFNSVVYLCFLPITVIIYLLTPKKARWMPLLIASIFFYMWWRPEFILLILFMALSDYVSALLIYRVSSPKPVLVISIIIDFGMLFVFKYLGFFSESIQTAFNILGMNVNVPIYRLILPMGISFHTFQGVAYVIDVYRGKVKPETNYLRLLLFILFFPQLVAGPIERAADLMNQLRAGGNPRLHDMSEGFGYLVLGFFKKAVVADRLAGCVSAVYGAPASYAGLPSIIATLFFAFQIYCDFSGYSDIAVGSAKLLGIEITRNFRQPYLSGSIREFWRRWHITLSSWLKDYVYIPLGGSRVSKPRHIFNIMVTFLASGLWHGADWSFILWGGLHGLFQSIESMISAKPPKKNIFNVCLTFILVCFTWIFFRADNIRDGIYILAHLFRGAGHWNEPQYIYQTLSGMGVTILDMLIDAGLIIIIILLDLFAGDDFVIEKSRRVLGVFSVMLLAVLFILTMSLSKFYNGGQFIYFQF